MAVSKENFRKSIERLAEAISQPKDDFVRDSVIQRFEFCVELAWKTTKKIMGTATSAPKDVVREMAQSNYIADVDSWLKAVDMRNLSAHTYNEEPAEKVYDFASGFLSSFRELWKMIEHK